MFLFCKKSVTIEAVTREIDESEDERTRREWTKEGTDKRGDWNKRRSCRVEHRDVTELIIGFCCDLAHSAFFLSAGTFVSLRRPTFRLSQQTHESRLTQKGYIPNEVLSATPLPYPSRISHSSLIVFFAPIFSVFTSFESNTAFFYPL